MWWMMCATASKLLGIITIITIIIIIILIILIIVIIIILFASWQLILIVSPGRH